MVLVGILATGYYYQKINEPDFNKIYFIQTNKPDVDSDYFELKVSFRKIKNIYTGKYKGSSLVLAKVIEEYFGPCYGACDPYTRYYRFIQQGEKMIFLSRISQSTPMWLNPFYDKFFKNIDLFPDHKWKFSIDEKTVIDGFYVSKEILIDNDTRKRLLFVDSTENVDISKHEIYTTDPILGDVYMLKVSESEALKPHIQTVDTPLEIRNYFVIQNADKVFSLYKYVPDVLSENSTPLTIFQTNYHQYTYQANRDCSGYYRDNIDVVMPPADQSILRQLGGQTVIGEHFYEPPVDEIKAFYEYYLKVVARDYESMRDHVTEFSEDDQKSLDEEPKSFEDFRSRMPLLVWKSPFGQWIRFTRIRYLKMVMCD